MLVNPKANMGAETAVDLKFNDYEHSNLAQLSSYDGHLEESDPRFLYHLGAPPIRVSRRNQCRSLCWVLVACAVFISLRAGSTGIARVCVIPINFINEVLTR